MNLWPTIRAVALAALGAVALRGAPASSPPHSVTDRLQPFLDRNVIAGAVVLIASPDAVLSLETIGYTDLKARVPMVGNDLFWIASMTKAVTGTALMMLVDEGKVSVDDPVEKYLPEFKGQKVELEVTSDRVILGSLARPITIRQLLSHTAGLRMWTPLEKHIDTLPLAVTVQTYPLLPLQFVPGTQYRYSNEGINTVGRIIEVVSGLSYADFLQRRLLTPLGMTDTTFWPNSEQLGRLAKSYRRNAASGRLEEVPIGQLSYPLSDRRRSACPAGGLFSTATDVSILCRMIMNGGVYQGRRYLSPEALAAMCRTQTGDLKVGDSGDGYGLGWVTSHHSSFPGLAESELPFGSGGAYNTRMWIEPARRRITILMVQQADPPKPEVAAMWAALTTPSSR